MEFVDLLFGTGAFIGHILITAVLVWIGKTPQIGAIVKMVGSTIMMLAIFTNMPPDNNAYLFVVVYFALAVTSITGNK